MSIITRHRPAILGIALAGVLGGVAVAVGSAPSAATAIPSVTAAAVPHSHPGRVHAFHSTAGRLTSGGATDGQTLTVSKQAVKPADTADRVDIRKGVEGRRSPTTVMTQPAHTGSGDASTTGPQRRVVPLRGALAGD